MSLSKRVFHSLEVTSGKLSSSAIDIQNATINNVVSSLISGGSLNLTGNLVVGGTVTTVNITTTNISDTNISSASIVANNANITTATTGTLIATTASAGTFIATTASAGTFIATTASAGTLRATTVTVGSLRSTTVLAAAGNSNTVGNIFTTGGNVGINIAAPAYHLDVNGNVHVNADLYVDGTISGGAQTSSTYAYLTLTATDESINLNTGSLVTFGGITIQAPTDAVSLTNGGSFLTDGGASIGKSLFVGGPVMRIPVGDTASRPSPGVQGTIRYNSTTSQFEGFGPGGAWGSLGGVVDIAQTTKVLASENPSITDGNLYFYTVNSERMRINSSGNIGIATTAPSALLDIAGNARVATTLFSTNITATNAVSTNLSSGTVIATTVSAGTAVATTYTGGSMRLSGSISTTLSSSFAIQIVGSNVDGPVIRYQNTASGGLIYHVGSTATGSGAGRGFSIYDVTNSATRMIIGSTGNIGIGTLLPQTPLHVIGNATISGALAAGSGTVGNFTSTISSAGTAVATTYTGGSMGLTGTVFSASGTFDQLVATNLSSGTVIATTLSAGTSVATTRTGGTLALSGSITVANIVTPGTVSAGTMVGTTFTGATLALSGSITAPSVVATTVSAGTSVAMTRTGATLALSGSITVANIVTPGTVSAGTMVGTTFTGATLALSGSITAPSVISTTLSAGTSVATTRTGGTLALSGSITAPSVVATTVSAGTSVATTRTGGTLALSGSITAPSVIATTVSAGTSVATTRTGGSIGLTGAVSALGDVRGASLIVGGSGTYTRGSLYRDANWGMLLRSGTENPTLAQFSIADANDNKLFTISPGGNISIGTSSSSSILHVESATPEITLRSTATKSASGVIGKITFSDSGNGGAAIESQNDIGGTNNNGNLIFRTSEDFVNFQRERLRINRSGNVGINTSTPTYRLHVVDSNTDATAMLENTAATGYAVMKYKTTTQEYNHGVGGVLSDVSNKIYWFYNNAVRMVLDTSGRLGIGTLTPSERLHVNGNINFTGSLYQNGSLFSGSSQWTSSVSNIFFNSGNVGIGTTSPQGPLHVSGTVGSAVSGNGIVLGVDGSTWSQIQLNSTVGSYIDFSSPNTDHLARIIYTNSNLSVNLITNSQTFLFASSGNFVCPGDISFFGNLSDARLKDQVSDISGPSALEMINTLRPVNFRWRDDIYHEAKRGEYDAGFIAQEVEQVLGLAVTDYTHEDQDYKALRHERFIPYLVAAIQQLSKKLSERASKGEPCCNCCKSCHCE